MRLAWLALVWAALLSAVPPGRVAGSGPEALDDVLLGSAYLSHRAAAADEAQAELRAASSRAAQQARQLASQALGARDGSGPSLSRGGRSYVDFSSLPLGIQVPKLLTESLSATSTQYPRYPSLAFFSPPPMLKGCPDKNSVLRYGATGGGVTDDADAIGKASQELDYLYFPPGSFRIGRSLTITKPILVGKGAQLNVDAGATLFLTQQPHYWDISRGMFGGAGKVVLMGGGANLVRPDWFKRPGDNDTDLLQRAVDSCGSPCTLVMTRKFYLGRAWYLNPVVRIASTFNGHLLGKNGTGEGVVLTPGEYTQPLHFAIMNWFTAFGVKIQGGVSGAEIQLSTMVKGKEAIVFDTDEGTGGTISNVFVTHFVATRDLQSTVVFRGSSAAHKLQNCLVRGNFVLLGGSMAPTEQSAGLTIAGAPPALEGTSVIFQAVDPYQLQSPSTKFTFLQNTAVASAGNVVYHVDAWGGGICCEGRLVAGKFSGLKFLNRMSTNPPSSRNTWPSLRLQGAGSLLTWSEVGSASIIRSLLATSPPSQAAFGAAIMQQVFYAKVDITTKWQPGEVRTFYFYSIYAISSAGMQCIPFRGANRGIVCAGFSNEHKLEWGRVAVQLKNAGRRAVRPKRQGAYHFGIQVGPW